MINKFKDRVNLAQNMGWRYIRFRGCYEVFRRTGLLKNKFPLSPVSKTAGSLEQWKEQAGNFFFQNKRNINVELKPSNQLKEWFDKYRLGKFVFFNSLTYDIGLNYDWVTNPETGFKYDIRKHWTEVADFSREAGDIKFVWEKSRFSFLYDLIRFDYHFQQDCSGIVFGEILSWIKNNPVNCGPNYRCSQEISLRVLNWIFALYYYRDSENLSEDVFAQIEYSIYWQLHHVYHNIDFSRIAVRNNHALTETLALFIAGMLFPYIPEVKAWGQKGKKWFEEELSYQVYEDGTFLQFSMNYHRVVIQLLTWGIRLSEINKDPLLPIVYERAEKSLFFLRTCMDDYTGRLPNYGANDGALFFKLNDRGFPDFRPQLNGLAAVLHIDAGLNSTEEDLGWYGLQPEYKKSLDLSSIVYRFPKGGYYLIREQDTLTFIRCGNHKDRPSQADNLHMDVWYKGKNILLDGGSYKYNTTEELARYFFGTASHNTVLLDEQDQMKKGGRFIWFYWTQCKKAELREDAERINFSGTISAFRQLGKNIDHQRTIIKTKGKPEWIIEDHIKGLPPGRTIIQNWNQPSSADISYASEAEEPLHPEIAKGWYSSQYGQKEETKRVIISSATNTIKTRIKINSEYLINTPILSGR
ncbi:heparinase II/III family protein [Chitinophagaceae bacterium LB-8]|uniref:Heparinase II/III family protein n=1 Tax=Paraflavisolibacter caeni TaxID=2982496 RepID=A0A9X2XU23_9BACT|nr:alginate lyase family protein [Paraflavisolibacter caeni]MCU7548487.1 heparinase II/III family protein [Paraflavisolibacter caeni]